MSGQSDAFTHIAKQLEQQNQTWQGIQKFIENFDPRTQLAIDPTLLADIETTCAERCTLPSGLPHRGLRA